MNFRLITTLMIVITILRVFIPDGVSMGLLYALPIFFSTPLKGYRYVIPIISIIIVTATCFLPNRHLPINTELMDKGAMIASLLLLSYLGAQRCRRDRNQICELGEINDYLIRRIETIDKETGKK